MRIGRHTKIKTLNWCVYLLQFDFTYILSSLYYLVVIRWLGGQREGYYIPDIGVGHSPYEQNNN